MLDGFIDKRRFSVELTMGVLHVYFPTEETWENTAPGWAKGLWAAAQSSASAWAKENSIPFDVDTTAWVDFEQPVLPGSL